ncbi:MAG TPA: sigma-70 family RNA polymerase sigma factor [Vicinamibacteria bacterium]
MAEAPGDRRAELASVLETDGDRLYRLALRVTRDPGLAEDAVQEAFTSALQALDNFRGDSRLGTWLHRIVYTKAVDLLRKRRLEDPLDQDTAELGPEDDRLAHSASWSRPPDALLASAEAGRAIEEALAVLTPRERAVFELRDGQERTTDETAEALGLRPGAVRVHLHRARLRLRAALASRYGGGGA